MMLNYFNLKENPFLLTHDMDFFCEFNSHKNLLGSLIENVKNGNNLLTITGEVGLGKTMVAHKLIHLLEDQGFIAIYVPTGNMTAHDLLDAIAKKLKVVFQETSKGYQVSKIQKALLELHDSGKSIVCIIDEAQMIAEDGLHLIRELSDLENGKSKLLHFALFGQPELQETLDQHSLRQFKQRVSYAYTVQPFNFEQTVKYIKRRLIKAGHTDGELLSKAALKYIFTYSNGNPRVINILTEKALQIASQKKSAHVGKHEIKVAMGVSSHLNKLSFLSGGELFFIFVLIMITGVTVFGFYTFFQ